MPVMLTWRVVLTLKALSNKCQLLDHITHKVSIYTDTMSLC